MSHLCAPVIEILSQVTCTHITSIQVMFPLYRGRRGEHKIKRNWANLMKGLPQLDTTLFRPSFNNLIHAIVGVTISDRLDALDQDLVEYLRLCLPKLDARGILGCVTRHFVHLLSNNNAFAHSVSLNNIKYAVHRADRLYISLTRPDKDRTALGRRDR